MTRSNFEEKTRMNRKVRVTSYLLFGLALVVMLLNRYYAVELGIEDSQLFIVLGTAMMVVSLTLMFKFSGSPRVLDEPANGIAHTLRRVGSAISLVGISSAFIAGYVAVAFPAEGFSSGMPPPYDTWFFPFFLSMLVLALAGVFLTMPAELGATWDKSRSEFPIPSTVLAAFKEIQPDRSFETKNFFVFRKGNAGILLNKAFGGVHFVRLFKETAAPHGKTNLPFVGLGGHRKSVFKDKVNGLPVARIEGEFTIPVEVVGQGDDADEKYARGIGVLYYVSAYPLGRGLRPLDFRVNLSNRFDKSTIFKILDDLSREHNSKWA